MPDPFEDAFGKWAPVPGGGELGGVGRFLTCIGGS